MAEALSETTIQIRAPMRLVDALEAEAARRMTSRSSVIRQILVEALGLDYAPNHNRQLIDPGVSYEAAE